MFFIFVLKKHIRGFDDNAIYLIIKQLLIKP